MAQAPFAKRRANPRFSFFAEVEITLDEGTSMLGEISELSCRGCYMFPSGPNCDCASPMVRTAANCSEK